MVGHNGHGPGPLAIAVSGWFKSVTSVRWGVTNEPVDVTDGFEGDTW
jgi:hypothetical protein